jgi:hypothetical protein
MGFGVLAFTVDAGVNSSATPSIVPSSLWACLDAVRYPYQGELPVTFETIGTPGSGSVANVVVVAVPSTGAQVIDTQ